MVACICRLNLLGIQHKLSVYAMHVGLLVICASAARSAWDGALDLQDYGIVTVGVCWFLVSWQTWKEGVPEHYKREVINGH